MFDIMKGTLYVLIPVLLMLIIILSVPVLRNNIKQRFWHAKSALKVLFSDLGSTRGDDMALLDESLQVVGYSYDPVQDIFLSTLDPWQKEYGYCRLYDEAAAPMGMIFDCEPIYFEYSGKKWLIEFWKGQYGLCTGCEIGIYSTDGPDLNIPGVFNGTFYKGVDKKDFLYVHCSIRKNGKRLFGRKGWHWWLTGFKLGEFSEPAELTMNINIKLKDRIMRNTFMNGLLAAGYSAGEFSSFGNTVSLIFDKPHTSQPTTRTKDTEELIQKRNKLLCEKFQEITSGCSTLEDKINAVKEKTPELLSCIMDMGKPKEIFSIYRTINEYLKY